MPSFMPSFVFTFVLSAVAIYAAVLLTATTYRLMRYGNTKCPHPFAFRFAFAYAAVETFMTPPLAQHRARMRAMRAAESRRAAALAHSMVRHPAGSAARAHATSTPAAEDDFITRARTVHVSDQVVASFSAAKALHPAARAAIG